MNVVCYEQVCYEQVCYEQVCFEREPLCGSLFNFL